METRPVVIGIAGPSCSGKTTLARGLADRFAAGGLVFELDWYYHDQSGRDLDEIEVDVPGAIDHRLAVAQLRDLLSGCAVERPDYDYATHSRRPHGVTVRPAPHIVVEGLFALYWPPLCALYRHAVFIEADAETCLRRRVARDTRERGRTAESVTRQFREKVWPMYERYVLPTRERADLVVDNSGDGGDIATKVIDRIEDR